MDLSTQQLQKQVSGIVYRWYSFAFVYDWGRVLRRKARLCPVVSGELWQVQSTITRQNRFVDSLLDFDFFNGQLAGRCMDSIMDQESIHIRSLHWEIPQSKRVINTSMYTGARLLPPFPFDLLAGAKALISHLRKQETGLYRYSSLFYLYLLWRWGGQPRSSSQN